MWQDKHREEIVMVDTGFAAWCSGSKERIGDSLRIFILPALFLHGGITDCHRPHICAGLEIISIPIRGTASAHSTTGI